MRPIALEIYEQMEYAANCIRIIVVMKPDFETSIDDSKNIIKSNLCNGTNRSYSCHHL